VSISYVSTDEKEDAPLRISMAAIGSPSVAMRYLLRDAVTDEVRTI
jgi:hypothetical protein